MWFRWRRIRAAPSSLGFGAHVSFLEAGFKLAQDHWQRGGGQWWAVVGSGSAISVLTALLVGGWSPAGSSIVLCSCVCREPLELLVGVPPAGDNGAASCLPKGLHRRRLPITYIIPVLVETNTFHHIHCLREGNRLSYAGRECSHIRS